MSKEELKSGGLPQEAQPIQTDTGEKFLTLSNGKSCRIVALNGKAMRDATRVSGDDSSKIMFALTALGTFIDGQPIVMEDLEEMPLRDAVKIQEAFSSLNF